MEEKIKKMIHFMREGDFNGTFILFKALRKSVDEDTLKDVLFFPLFKFSIESGFVCENIKNIEKMNTNSKKEIKEWIYNIIVYIQRFENEHLFIPRLVQLFSCIVLPIDIFNADHQIYCRDERMKCEIISSFALKKKESSNFLMYVSFNIVELLYNHLNLHINLMILMDFMRFCLIFLFAEDHMKLWKLFRIFITLNFNYSNNKEFISFFDVINSQAIEQSKFSPFNLSSIACFGYMIIYNVQNKSCWMSHQKMNLRSEKLKIPNTMSIKNNREDYYEKYFISKYKKHSPLLNQKLNDKEELVAENLYYEILKARYIIYHTKDVHFSVSKFINQRSLKMFPRDEMGFCKDSNVMSKDFFIQIIDPFMLYAVNNLNWIVGIRTVENNYLIPWVYTVNSLNNTVCGSFLRNETSYLNRWKHFLILVNAPSYMIFDIYDLNYARFYTIHSKLCLENPLSIVNHNSMPYYITYLLGMYIIGYPSSFVDVDIVVDNKKQYFYAGIFRKCTIDENSARNSVIQQLSKNHFNRPSILAFINNLKKEFAKEKYSFIINDAILESICQFKKWDSLIDEFSKNI